MKHSVLSQLGQRTAAPPISWLMEMALGRPRLISLAAGFTDNPSLPLREARELLAEILSSRTTGEAALQYGPTLGDPELRQRTAAHLEKQDPAGGGEGFPVKNILITNGSQQLLYLLTEALCDPGDIVLVEDPTYFVYLSIAQSHGLRCRGVRLQPDGLDLAQLEETLDELKRSGDLRRVKMLYVVSYFQNPSGVTMSLAKKVAALALLRRYERAAGHPIYLLEDAAYRELGFDNEGVPSARSLPGAGERVIYTGTYSKPFATGVRVGFGWLPEPVFTRVSRIKGNHDFGTASLLQRLLACALRTGRYQLHLVELQKRYAHKARVMTAAIEEHFPATVRWEKPQGGLYVWAQLPARRKTGAKSKVFQSALAKNVLYVPGELCYADDPSRPKPNHEMRLSFGNASTANIREGIVRLGKVLRGL